MKLILTLLALSLAFLATYDASNVQASYGHARSATCAEDEPCFRWYKDGNGMRGIFVKGRGDVRVIVGRRAFCRYSRAGRINWAVTPVLRGDRAACSYWR